MSAPANLHGTALVVGRRGLLIRGPSGSGKSSLAASLLRRAAAEGLEARLVADDQVAVSAGRRAPTMRPFPATRGLLELRGLGLVQLPFLPRARLDLVVDLVERAAIERLPEPATAMIAGQPVTRVVLPERDPAFGADLLLTYLLGKRRKA